VIFAVLAIGSAGSAANKKRRSRNPRQSAAIYSSTNPENRIHCSDSGCQLAPSLPFTILPTPGKGKCTA
jgi:hypothetical protein